MFLRPSPTFCVLSPKQVIICLSAVSISVQSLQKFLIFGLEEDIKLFQVNESQVIGFKIKVKVQLSFDFVKSSPKSANSRSESKSKSCDSSPHT